MRTRYLYKLYRDNIYLGLIRKPSNDFEYSQDINTGSVQVVVEIPSTIEGAGIDVDTDLLVTENGDYIVTSAGDKILLRKDYVFNTIQTDLGNRLKVIKFHDGAVNGEPAFDGLITSWKTNYKTNNLVVTALSWGVKLDNYLVETAVGTAVVEHNVTDEEVTQYTFDYNGTLTNDAFFAQTFEVLSETTISSIRVRMRLDAASTTPVEYICSLDNDPPGTFGPDLAYVSRLVSNTAMEWVEFVFPAPVTVTPGTTYHFLLYMNTSGPTSGPMYLQRDSTGSYADGTLYIQQLNGSSNYVNTGTDLVFEIITSSGGGNIGGVFNSKDPSSVMRELLDSFERRGGLVTYTDDSIQDTNTVVSYTFKFDTLLDAIRKYRELSPSNWYWYVDPGTNIFHFKRQGNTADHTMKLGVHVENLDLEYTLDDVKNVVYFSGGDLGGTNLLTLNTNPLSQRKYGVWLDKPADGRVLLEDTANILSRSILSQNANAVFRTTLTIPATVYNIETFKLGQMVGFGRFNELINGLLLQIVSIYKRTDIITLYLQTLPPTTSHRVEDIKRNLDAVQTVNNPSTVT